MDNFKFFIPFYLFLFGIAGCARFTGPYQPKEHGIYMPSDPYYDINPDRDSVLVKAKENFNLLPNQDSTYWEGEHQVIFSDAEVVVFKFMIFTNRSSEQIKFMSAEGIPTNDDLVYEQNLKKYESYFQDSILTKLNL